MYHCESFLEPDAYEKALLKKNQVKGPVVVILILKRSKSDSQRYPLVMTNNVEDIVFLAENCVISTIFSVLSEAEICKSF